MIIFSFIYDGWRYLFLASILLMASVYIRSFRWKFLFQTHQNKNIRVMDLTAITLCKENMLPIHVFNINKNGDLKNLLVFHF